MYVVVVQKFTFAISSPDEFLYYIYCSAGGIVFFCSEKLYLLSGGGHKSGNLETWNTQEFSEPGKLREFSGNSVQPQGKL